jgi:hypothetical protein
MIAYHAKIKMTGLLAPILLVFGKSLGEKKVFTKKNRQKKTI